jgi:LPXTG-site transpeptidase (sortase) family protein
MSSPLAWLGNLLVALSLGGGAFLAFGPSPEDLLHGQAHPAAPPITTATRDVRHAAPDVVAPTSGSNIPAPAPTEPPEPGASPVQPGATSAPLVESLPITRVVIPSIGLDSQVVTARFVERDGATTWEIPKNVAGHAEYTAGAGDRGNAVLLGHVSSLHSGDVFHDLERVQVGDVVTVYGGDAAFAYKVVDIKTVPRTDTTMLRTTEIPSLSLFTCTGTWQPTVWDYSDRLVVRAELVDAPRR